MIIRLIQLVLISALIILQYAFGENLFFMNVFNLMLLFVVFFSAVSSWQNALLISAVSGLTVDFISYLPFGFYLLLALSVMFLVRGMVKYIFTSLSLVSIMAISIIATAVYWFLVFLFSRILLMLELVDYYPLFGEGMLFKIVWQVFFHALIIGVIFFLASRLSKHFNLAFLKK